MFNKLFIEKTNSTKIQFFRYFFVGGTGFVTDFVIYFILTRYFHLFYITANIISFMTAMAVTYVMSVAWVFPQRSERTMLAEFGIFAAIGVIGLAINSLVLGLLTQKMHIFDLIAKVVAAAIVYIWNFFVRKYFLFNEPPVL